MKIAHIGNLCNLGFIYSSFLRKMGVDAHLYIHDQMPVTPMQWDGFEDETNASWVHRYPRKPLSMALNQIPLGLELAKYDLIHSWCCSLLPPLELILALKGTPYFGYATGSDLREAALTNTINGIRIRRHFRNAVHVAHHHDDPLVEAAEKIGLKGCSVLKFPVGETEPKDYDLNQDRETVFFMPSRFHFTPTVEGQVYFKNNDRFLRAFGKYINNGGKARLIALRRGGDLEKAIEMINEMGIGEHITWKEEMTPYDLAKSFYDCDVVVDQFTGLSYPIPGGMIPLEAMAHGTPVIASFDEKRNRAQYGSAAPILHCLTEDEIYDRIVQCEDKEFIRQQGLTSKEWTTEHHGWQTIMTRMIDRYSKAIHNSKEQG